MIYRDDGCEVWIWRTGSALKVAPVVVVVTVSAAVAAAVTAVTAVSASASGRAILVLLDTLVTAVFEVLLAFWVKDEQTGNNGSARGFRDARLMRTSTRYWL
jgi:hypothetical protein